MGLEESECLVLGEVSLIVGSCSGWSHWSHHTGEKFRNVKTSYYERRLSNRDFHIKGYYEALIAEEMGSWPRVPSNPMILYLLGDVEEISNNGSTDVAWFGWLANVVYVGKKSPIIFF